MLSNAATQDQNLTPEPTGRIENIAKRIGFQQEEGRQRANMRKVEWETAAEEN